MLLTRQIQVGTSQLISSVLFVCHCVRESESVIRIISVRRADRFEQKQYTERLRK
jgi:uncharacterized DUF497 family protein